MNSNVVSYTQLDHVKFLSSYSLETVPIKLDQNGIIQKGMVQVK